MNGRRTDFPIRPQRLDGLGNPSYKLRRDHAFLSALTLAERRDLTRAAALRWMIFLAAALSTFLATVRSWVSAPSTLPAATASITFLYSVWRVRLAERLRSRWTRLCLSRFLALLIFGMGSGCWGFLWVLLRFAGFRIVA